MATRPPLIHPKMLERLDLFYDKTCTIKYDPDLEDSYDEHGQPQPNYVNFPEHVDLDCAISPDGGREVKNSEMTYTVSTHKISLKGNFPNIKGNMIAVVAGKSYNILLPEVDSRSKTTRLSVEIVEG